MFYKAVRTLEFRKVVYSRGDVFEVNLANATTITEVKDLKMLGWITEVKPPVKEKKAPAKKVAKAPESSKKPKAKVK